MPLALPLTGQRDFLKFVDISKARRGIFKAKITKNEKFVKSQRMKCQNLSRITVNSESNIINAPSLKDVVYRVIT